MVTIERSYSLPSIPHPEDPGRSLTVKQIEPKKYRFSNRRFRAAAGGRNQRTEFLDTERAEVQSEVTEQYQSSAPS